MNLRFPCKRHRILEILLTSQFDYYQIKGQFVLHLSKKNPSKYRNEIYKIYKYISGNCEQKFLIKPLYKIRSENCFVRPNIGLANFRTEPMANYAAKLCHAIPPEIKHAFSRTVCKEKCKAWLPIR